MTTIKTSELTGISLDWAVAKCEGSTDLWFDSVATHWIMLDGEERALLYGWSKSYLPSTIWAHGGPIIERERINVDPSQDSHEWFGYFDNKGKRYAGLTPLIAAMRCYVASQLGDYVEIPDSLIKS